jgi:hypothetical protein
MKQLSRAAAPAPQRPSGALLRLGAPADRLEQEADAVAARVLSGQRIAALGVRAAPGLRAAPGHLQRDSRSPWSADEGRRRDEDAPATGGTLQRAPQCGAAATTVSPERSPTTSRSGSPAGSFTESPAGSPTGSPTTSPTLSPALASRIHSLRGGGTPLPGAVRGLLEPRFGHDFGRVRIHRDSSAAALAERVNARAFTLGRDVVFGTGQYDTGSRAGLRLLAHELTHVVQQGAAPRQADREGAPEVCREIGPEVAPESGPEVAREVGPEVGPVVGPDIDAPAAPRAALQAGPQASRPGPGPDPGHDTHHGARQSITPAPGEAQLQRMAWFPNRDTGTAHAPWGDDGPQGRLLEARTDAGAAVEAWRPDDGQTYWCHGYTFGGAAATGGPYSVFGSVVPRVLQDDGWHAIDACMARPNDILVFYDHEDHEAHSGIVRNTELVSGQVDEALSDLQSKWGTGMLATVSWATNARQYGHYTAYSKAPLSGACAAKGANER